MGSMCQRPLKTAFLGGESPANSAPYRLFCPFVAVNYRLVKSDGDTLLDFALCFLPHSCVKSAYSWMQWPTSTTTRNGGQSPGMAWA